MSAASATADGGASTLITSLHPDIIKSHILNRLDGPNLTSTASASTHLLSLCSDDHLWRRICNSTWPSTAHPSVRSAISNFPSAHRSFYNDSFPTVRFCREINGHVPHTSELISAVDVLYDGVLIFSKVISTETISSSFISSPFRLDLLGSKESVATPLQYDGDGVACVESAKERLTVSWILIDPYKRRAVSVASVSTVDVRRHWITEDVQLRYARVVRSDGGEMVEMAVAMTFGGMDSGEMQLKEMSMQVDDVEGRTLTGEDVLVILDTAMEGHRCKIAWEEEKDMYEVFLKRKVQLEEKGQKKDTSWMVFLVLIFLLLLFFIL